jgi:hypothetical protein
MIPGTRGGRCPSNSTGKVSLTTVRPIEGSWRTHVARGSRVLFESSTLMQSVELFNLYVATELNVPIEPLLEHAVLQKKALP